VDLHYVFRRNTSHRVEDGIHWDGQMHRAITNMLVYHVCHAWHVKLPARKSVLGEPPQRRPMQSLLKLKTMPSRPHFRRFHPQQYRQHPVTYQQYHQNMNFTTGELNMNNFCSFRSLNQQYQQNVNFTTDELDMNNFCSFLSQNGFSQTGFRQFGSDVTNIACHRRGASNLRNYRQRPY